MDVESKYTTQEKITADKEGKEAKKTTLSNDAFAVCEFLESLIKKIEKTRVSLK